MNAITIRLPPLPTAPIIPGAWLETRDALAAELNAIIVADNCGFQAASEIYNKGKKHAAALEKQRLAFSAPFSNAAKEIKAVADKALKPLYDAIDAANEKIAPYAAAERERERKEREAAEQAARDAAAKASAEAEDMAELTGEAPEPVAEIEPVAVERRAVSRDIRIGERVVFNIVAPDDVPRGFCMPDERAIREYIKANEEAYKAALRENPEWTAIPGVTMKIETTVGGR